MSHLDSVIDGVIIFTDIVGSSKLWRDHPRNMTKSMNIHNTLIENIAKDYSGVVVKTIGDAFMIFIKGKTAYKKALNLSVKIQDSLINNPIWVNERTNRQILVRIGFCQGPMNVQQVKFQKKKLKDYFGTTVNLASRMESKVAALNGISFCFWETDIPENFLMDVANKFRMVVKDYTNSCQYRQSDVYKCFRTEDLYGAPGVITFSIVVG